jgi:hypothetical protein
MKMRKYDPERTIPYLSVVREALKNFREFRHPSDITIWINADCLTDITDAPETKELDEFMPVPSGFDLKYFHFKESDQRIGGIELVFHGDLLVNCRIQMTFGGLFANRKAKKFISSALHPCLVSVIGADEFEYSEWNETYYYKYFNGLVVAYRKVPNLPGVSTWITDKFYF